MELLLGLTMATIIFILATNVVISFLNVNTRSRASSEVEQVKRDVISEITNALTWGGSISYVDGVLKVDRDEYKVIDGRLLKNNNPMTAENVVVSNMAIKRFVESKTVVNPATGRGLVGNYYTGENFSELKKTQTDFEINFDWGFASPTMGLPNDFFSVRWTGSIEAPRSGNYTFYVQSDDGVRLWINNNLIIDRWREQPITETRGSISLESGKLSEIRIEYFEKRAQAAIKLFWSGPSISKSIVPSSYLYTNSPTTSISFDLDITHRDFTSQKDTISLFVSPRTAIIESILPPPSRTPTPTPTALTLPSTSSTPITTTRTSNTPSPTPTRTPTATTRPPATATPVRTPTPTPVPTPKPLR